MTSLLKSKGSSPTRLGSFGVTPRYLKIFSILTLTLVLIPLLYLIIRASENGVAGFNEILNRPKTISAISTSLLLALVVAIGSIVIGVFVALVVGKTNVFFRRLFLLLMPIPLAIPSYVIAYSYLTLNPFLNGFWISALILVLATFPFVAIPTYALLRKINISQEEVARTLGLNPVKVLWFVIWPQVRTASVAGGLLSALYALGEFGTVSFMRLDTLTRVIYTSYRATFDRSSAASLGLILLAVSLLIVFLERKGRGLSTATINLNRTGGILNIGNLRYLVFSIILLIYSLSLAIPGYVLISRTLSVGVNIQFSEILSRTFNTASVAFLGATLALVLALPVGILSARFKSKFALTIERSLLITHALPGVVVGLALVALGARYLTPLYQTIYLLAFAYALLFIANSLGTVRSSLEKIPIRLDEVSRSLGQSFTQTLRRVILPIATPGILSGWLLVFVTAMKELPATLMLKPTGFETLSTSLWTATSISQYAQAAPVALALVLVASIPSYLLNRPNLAKQNQVRENRTV